MKIAMVAPFEESVPPKKYGGTELVIYNLVTELVRLGHDVTLFATGDSEVPSKLDPIFPTALRTTPPYDRDQKTREAAKFLGIGKVLSRLSSDSYDVVHNHIGWRLLLFHELIKEPLVTTLHGPMDIAYQHVGFLASPSLSFISISDNQRKALPTLNYVATVYNGIDLSQFTYSDTHDDYLFFLGRFSPEKGAREAIEIARRTGKTLKMACKIDLVDKEYFEATKPLIDGKQIQLIGELNHTEKISVLAHAKALLAPIQWEEPFGLFVVEAMACGTPVLGIARGSFPEIIEHGKNGFLARSAEELVPFVDQISQIDRRRCRSTVEERFTKEIMASKYIEVYKKILNNS